MSFTVLQNIIEKGVFFLSSPNNHSSQLKHRNCLSACKTVNLLSLLGLTIMRHHFSYQGTWLNGSSFPCGQLLSAQEEVFHFPDRIATQPLVQTPPERQPFLSFQAPFDKKVLLIVRKWKSPFVQSGCKKCSVFHLTPVVIWAYFSAVMYMMIQHTLLQFLQWKTTKSWTDGVC